MMNRLPKSAIVVVGTVLHMCLGTVYAWSYFQSILVLEAGWTFTETGLVFGITIGTIGVSAWGAGQALQQLGPTKLALAGSLLFSGGYIVSSIALGIDSVPLFCIGYGVIGGAGIGLGYVTPVATVAKWFPDKKGLVTGSVVMGFGLGALVLSKVLAPLLLEFTGGDLQMVFLWLGVVFACVLIPCSLLLRNPQWEMLAPEDMDEADGESIQPYLTTWRFVLIWFVFFFNIAAGISVISFQSQLFQEVWLAVDSSLGPLVLAERGATLIAVSSVCNGVGRLLFGSLADRIGRAAVFRILLGSQMIVFGLLMTETNPFVFGALICYVLLCFGGGFATMPSLIIDVFGPKNMSKVYGIVLTAWAMAGIVGPLYVGYLKDIYPDRAVMYCFLIGIVMLGAGYVLSYLLGDDRLLVGRPTLRGTLRRYGVPIPDMR